MKLPLECCYRVAGRHSNQNYPIGQPYRSVDHACVSGAKRVAPKGRCSGQHRFRLTSCRCTRTNSVCLPARLVPCRNSDPRSLSASEVSISIRFFPSVCSVLAHFISWSVKRLTPCATSWRINLTVSTRRTDPGEVHVWFRVPTF